MPTLEEVKDQISHLDTTSKLFGHKEIKELPNILWEDERIEKLVQGLYEKKNGILVATNKRLIFIDKGLIYGLRVEDFPYDKVSSIQYKTGLIFGELTIFASGNKADIQQVDKKIVRNFSDYVRARITEIKEHPNHPSEVNQNSSGDLADQIKKLADLKDQGILTEEEFSAKKKKLLGI
ncbi:hypothetical protein EQO05_07175 [Methanosarcina sp. MSH10X1]|uniref:PH domain-containing protein n=1 Tax=Methanosarcina sp. MSH10X1 TaxID=2507075 RepID=UPI000FFBF5C3|nr:PH domain-containing protein [Methanosarcina sp. MSH10X1]RXA19922.1 hypothetical protein EQO05_07175 [Methanosarcina sp. MSH10X1]